MSEFDQLRRELRAALDDLEAAREGRLQSHDAARRHDAATENLRRRSGNTAENLGRLEEVGRGLAGRFEEQTTRVVGLRAEAQRAAERFARLPDPPALIENWAGGVPILLLPFRLETRFKQLGDGSTELWIRVYPDEISVAAFEERLSAAEVAAARAFWDAEWRAGADEAARLGAWRVLVGAVGAERAEYAVSVYRPNNPAARPAQTVPAAEPLAVAPQFDAYEPRLDPWTAAPRMLALPERWTFVGYGRAGDAKPAFTVTGRAIRPDIVAGPDPSVTEAEGFKVNAGLLEVAETMRWMFNFEEAVAAGMGVKVRLKNEVAARGFERLFLVGLRFRDDAEESPQTLQDLIRAHRFSPNGFALVPQGAPTNNTGEAAPYALDPGDEDGLRAALGAPFYETQAGWLDKRDGQYLAEALALPADALARVHGAGGWDQRDARAMNTALWPSTLGYFLDEMLEPRVGDEDARSVRAFFVENVRARGPLPAVRVGAQPYGVLPVTAFSRWQARAASGQNLSLAGRPRQGFAEDLLRVLLRMLDAWKVMARDVSYAGKTGDHGRILLDILGLHPTSAEYHQRYAAGSSHVWNYLRLGGYDAQSVRFYEHLVLHSAAVFRQLGFPADPSPAIFDKIFFTRETPIDGPLIDGRPLSETDALEPAAADNRNYLAWLGTSSLDEIRMENFGEGRQAPGALLYKMLRHAALLSYDEAAVNLFLSSGLLKSRPRENEILYAGTNPQPGRWERLYSPAPEITGSQTLLMSDFLASSAVLTTRPETRPAADFAAAVTALSQATTARLERAFAEHVDLCSYRLDAWLGGLINEHLASRRAPGLYLGGYGWLENVSPKQGGLKPVPPESVPQTFRDGPLFVDEANAGYVFSPSISHAVAASVMRNAYVTHADPSSPAAMSVNLSSARVRAALNLLEGIRNGQGLGALLGYQFERGLHDRHGLGVEVDQFIYPLRLKFPIKAGQQTPLPPGVTIEQVEARDVVDGLKLLERTRETGAAGEPSRAVYPFGFTDLPPTTDGRQAAAINAEVNRLRDAVDALADLCQSESVFQVVKGNYERAGAMLKAISEGNNPPEPEIVETPRSGLNVTARLLLQFETGLDPALPSTNPYDGSIAMTPRARFEPGVNRWLASMLPPLDSVALRATTRDAPAASGFVTLSQLGLQPVDLVWLADSTFDGQSSLGRLAAGIFRRDNGVADSVEVGFDEAGRDPSWGADRFSLFEIRPLLQSLRRVVADSRALAADDYILPSDVPGGDAKAWDVPAWRARIEAAASSLTTLRGLLVTRRAALDAAAEPFNPAAFDDARAAMLSLHPFGFDDAVPQSAGGTSPGIRTELLEQADALLRESEKRLTAVADVVAGLAAAPNQKTALDEAVAALFGGAFRSLPEFRLHNPAELVACHDDRVRLRRHSPSHTSERDWLHGVSRVRTRAASLETAFLFSEMFGRAALDLATWQLPWKAEDYWLAVEYPPTHEPSRENLLLNVHHTAPFRPAANQAGLLVDDWTELIPNRQETAALAVHFDRPNSEPPQALLLAVSPRLEGAWRWEDLLAVLGETLDLARVRAVEPEQIDKSSYAQLLPATMAAVTRHLLTIALNYTAAVAVQT